MNGYYRRKPNLPLEEFRPLELNEIEFVSDLGDLQEDESTELECPICGSHVVTNDYQTFCTRCSWITTDENPETLDEEN